MPRHPRKAQSLYSLIICIAIISGLVCQNTAHAETASGSAYGETSNISASIPLVGADVVSSGPQPMVSGSGSGSGSDSFGPIREQTNSTNIDLLNGAGSIET